LLVAGTLCVGLAVIGIVVPLLPTTPFLLLAAVCYARSSDRFYQRLLSHPWLGEPIRNFRERRGLRRRQKVVALLTLWASIAVTLRLALAAGWVAWLLVAVALGVTVYVLRLETLPDSPAAPQAEEA
jgi:uncharacterized membrane protein YbaN (DUF454 family)